MIEKGNGERGTGKRVEILATTKKWLLKEKVTLWTISRE